MGKYDKLLVRVMSGSSDANIDFDELCQLLIRLGFDTRVRGSHHIFFKQGIIERINLQNDGVKTKTYRKQLIFGSTPHARPHKKCHGPKAES